MWDAVSCRIQRPQGSTYSEFRMRKMYVREMVLKWNFESWQRTISTRAWRWHFLIHLLKLAHGWDGTHMCGICNGPHSVSTLLLLALCQSLSCATHRYLINFNFFMGTTERVYSTDLILKREKGQIPLTYSPLPRLDLAQVYI